jgi:hypothetical protein
MNSSTHLFHGLFVMKVLDLNLSKFPKEIRMSYKERWHEMTKSEEIYQTVPLRTSSAFTPGTDLSKVAFIL